MGSMLKLPTLSGAFALALACMASAQEKSLTDTEVAPAQESTYFAADRFEPTSKWRLSRKGDGCTIRRDFAHEDGREATLTWQRVHPGSTVQVGLFGDEISRQRGTLETQFVPSSGYGKHGFVANAALGEKSGVAFATLLFAEIAMEEDIASRAAKLADLKGQATHYVITGASRKPIALHTGAVTAGLAALDKCAQEKLETLGPFEGAMRGARPVDQANWARKLQQNYPREAMRSNWSGPVPVRLVINEKGRAVHCDTLHQLAAKPLQEAACNGLEEHGRFEPATDADGKPMRGIYITNVVYKLTGGFAVDAHGMLVRPRDNADD